MRPEIKRFSDFAEEEGPLEGAKVKIDSILNQEIFVTGYKVKKSKYSKKGSGQCLTVQFETEEEGKKIFFTGSSVLLDQVEKYGSEIPFMAVIKKIDRYYTFS
ncbi:MAG: hypothetical protein JRC60_00195 [Deltaproteobacteria bacterium]|nr:hypothetical protein [Deltaproteobacteria bacterium]